MKRLGSDLNTAQKEMKAKHKAYENAVGILSRRLQEALAAKESSEAELNKLKAQIDDGENSQASQVRKHHIDLIRPSDFQLLHHSGLPLKVCSCARIVRRLKITLISGFYSIWEML